MECYVLNMMDNAQKLAGSLTLKRRYGEYNMNISYCTCSYVSAHCGCIRHPGEAYMVSPLSIHTCETISLTKMSSNTQISPVVQTEKKEFSLLHCKRLVHDVCNLRRCA